ncbi:hypothetical protein Hanom_Chr13g01201451 [Helianthus anomalus]
MRGMRLSSTGCVFEAKPNKKWTRGHGMRPWSEASCSGCVGNVSETSCKISDELM